MTKYIKYNYKNAAKIWDRYYNLCIDNWSCGDSEKQQARRDFMRCLTRKTDLDVYIDYIREQIDYIKPIPGAKSRIYDFEYEKQLEELIQDIENFYNTTVIITTKEDRIQSHKL